MNVNLVVGAILVAVIFAVKPLSRKVGELLATRSSARFWESFRRCDEAAKLTGAFSALTSTSYGRRELVLGLQSGSLGPWKFGEALDVMLDVNTAGTAVTDLEELLEKSEFPARVSVAAATWNTKRWITLAVRMRNPIAIGVLVADGNAMQKRERLAALLNAERVDWPLTAEMWNAFESRIVIGDRTTEDWEFIERQTHHPIRSISQSALRMRKLALGKRTGTE